MNVIICLASPYGMRCLESIEQVVTIAGIITTKKEFRIRFGDTDRVMENQAYTQVCEYAQKKNVPLYQIEKMNSMETEQFIRNHSAELMIVSGWYHLIKKNIMDLFPKGVIGLHSSMLPRYRGGAPLVWQMINGEPSAGITLFYLDEGVDSGDIIAQKQVDILEEDTIKTLYDKVGNCGIELLLENLTRIEKGTAARKKQENLSDEDIWPQRKPEDGMIDWSMDPKQIRNFVRAQTKPYPGAFTYIGSKKVIIWDCDIEETES